MPLPAPSPDVLEKRTLCHDGENYDDGVSVMAVLIETVFPDGVTNELLDAVTDEMGVDGSTLPPGGILHVHFEKAGPFPRRRRVGLSRGVSAVCPSRRLLPAMGKVATARGLDPSNVGVPEETITEVHRIVH